MFQFLNRNYDKYLSILLLITQHILLILYINQFFLTRDTIISDKIAYIIILINFCFIYIASFIRRNNDRILKRSIFIISLTLWQYLFITNSNFILNSLGIVMQPLVIYFYTVETLNLLLYEKIEFKKRFDRLIQGFLIITITSFFINQRYFNLLYLVIFILLHFYPLLVLLIYRKYMSGILIEIRKSCLLFSIFLLMLMFTIVVDSISIDNAYSNLGWYITISIIGIVSYIRVIRDALFLKVKEFTYIGVINNSIVILLMLILWGAILSMFIKHFKVWYLVINITILFIFLIFLYGMVCYDYKKQRLCESIEDFRLARLLYSEEQVKKRVATYLHDEILQSIIAVKNLVSLKNSEINSEFIVRELSELVKSIRDEMDTYQPIISNIDDFKEVLEELVDNTIKKYNSNKNIEFICEKDIVIYQPYNSIIYRIMKELINNAIKYSSGYTIYLSLKIEFDTVYITIENPIFNEENIIFGRGLKDIKETVDLLGGYFEYKVDNRFFQKIILPMNRSICYENFIDR